MTKIPSYYRGVAYAFAGFTSWVLADVSLKFIGESLLPKYEITAFMGLSGIITIFVITLLCGKRRNLRPQSPKGLTILGVLLTTNILAMLIAFKYLPLTNIYAITFATPMLTALGAAVFLKERVTRQQSAAIVIGFAGVIIAIDFSLMNAVKGSVWGYAAAFSVLFLNTASMLALRIYAQSETPECIAFYPRFFAGAAGFIMCALGHFEPVSAAHIMPLFLAGFLAALGWMFLAAANHTATASEVAPFRYSQIITTALCGYLIWNDIPSWNVVTGVIIITAAGLHTIKNDPRSRRVKNPEPIS